MISLIGFSALLGSVIYFIVAFEYSLILRKTGVLFLPAFLISAVWALSTSTIYTTDFLHITIWSACFLASFQQNKQLIAFTFRWFILWSIPCLSMMGTLYSLVASDQPTQSQFYLYLLCCIGTLLIVEQLIRNSTGLIKATSIGMGALFLYNLYLYSDALIAGQMSAEVVQARGLANTTVGLILCFAPLVLSRKDEQRRKMALSRPLVLSTTSLMIAGATLLFVSTIGYLLRIIGDDYALMQPFFLFLGVLLVGFNLGSSGRRARTRVWIDKHFFQTKFDYNEEWRKLSDRLVLNPNDEGYAAIALEAILPIYNGTGGVCYLVEGGQYVPVQRLNLEGDIPSLTSSDEHLFLDKMLQDNWIYLPNATDPQLSRFNDLIPHSITQLDSILLILPLANSEKLIGFLAVSADLAQTDKFDWEDLDLLRMVGKQVSNFVAYQMISTELVITRQFEAFNRFTTFVMHDLKNLIAQQALVVENAARFIDNPEFVSDAIDTIDNSVGRMSHLLSKINQNVATDLALPQIEPTAIQDIFERALQRCNGSLPEPKLHMPEQEIFVSADPDALVMAFTHMLSNAQEACEDEGLIEIEMELHATEVECKIRDNGAGMTQAFIDNRLFKPFDTTKKSQGMGIGAYQYKQIISNIGGRISVSSQIGEGTCFTVTLPLFFNPGIA